MNGLGKYYRCCVPCLCDLMTYTKVERHTVQLSDGPYEHFVITMDDPCINPSNIPGEVSSYQCSGGTTQNGVHAASGRLIVAVLFGHHETSLNNQYHMILIYTLLMEINFVNKGFVKHQMNLEEEWEIYLFNYHL